MEQHDFSKLIGAGVQSRSAPKTNPERFDTTKKNLFGNINRNKLSKDIQPSMQRTASIALGPVLYGMSGFGGHSDECHAIGKQSTEACQAALKKANCDVISFKSGKCFLHSTNHPDFYLDHSPGHWAQKKISNYNYN